MRSKIKNIYSIKQSINTCGMFKEMRMIKLYRNVYYSDGTSRTNRLRDRFSYRITLDYERSTTLKDRIYINRGCNIRPLSEKAKNVYWCICQKIKSN